MKLNIAENIRSLRRGMKLTQEQLAEALGVTVGAVSKWESGANTPDVSLIAELASFFEVSIDSLLDYEVPGGGLDALLKRIADLTMGRNFTQAMAEAEKALAKYPNNFKVARLCANTYCLAGLERSDDSCHRRQLELYRKALTLIDQNTDPKISEWSIKNRIAEAHVFLNEDEKALEIMKANNAQGTNDCNIAAVLTENLGRYDEGLKHMFDDMVYSISHIMTDTITGAIAYVSLGSPTEAERLVNWSLGMYEGLLISSEPCYVQRESARVRLLAAFAALADGRRADAAAYLARAKAQFDEYMSSGDNSSRNNSLSGTWLRNGEKYRGFNDLGDDILAGARKMLEKLQSRLVKAQDVLPNFDTGGAALTEIWDGICADK